MQQHQPSLTEMTRVWWRIGVLSFGGPASQIALMHREIVETHHWLDEQEYLNALGFCMLLPGPEAMQLATYSGWRMHGVTGGLIAGLLFVLPGAAVIMALAAIYSLFGDVPIVEALFYGVKAAVLVIVLEALLKVSKRALNLPIHWIIAASAFLGIFLFSVPFPLIVIGSALLGAFTLTGSKTPSETRISVPIRHTLKTILVWLVIWALPFGLLWLSGANPILHEIGQFFSTLAVVTFGGAYAVVAYMAQDVVNFYGWLTAAEMIDALGLAETTPGPLILVTQFVGFIAGFKEGGMSLALLAAIVTLWVTFAPCFLWIFAGAPYIAWISAQPRLKSALSAITAAVVGVILNLSIWFALHVFFADVAQTKWGLFTLWRPDFASIEWLAVGIFVFGVFLLFRARWGLLWILAVSAVLSAAIQVLSSL